MAGLRFADLQSRPMEFLDFTSLTLDEFQQLVPPFSPTLPVSPVSPHLNPLSTSLLLGPTEGNVRPAGNKL